MAWRLKAAGLITSLVFLSGCATVDLTAGFSDVSAAVEQRSALKIVWNNGSDLDREAEEKIRFFLRRKLTVDEAVQIALLNNREIQASYSELGVAQADLVQAGLFKNPIFDAAVTFPTSGGRPDLELTAVMNFLDIFYIPLRKRVAAARLEETKLRVTGTVLDFAGRVRRDFYLHQANEQMLELRQTIVQALSASLDVARRLHEAGNISDLISRGSRRCWNEGSWRFARQRTRDSEPGAAEPLDGPLGGGHGLGYRKTPARHSCTSGGNG